MLTQEQIQHIVETLTGDDFAVQRDVKELWATRGIETHDIRLLGHLAEQFLKVLDQVSALQRTSGWPVTILVEDSGSSQGREGYRPSEQTCPKCGSGSLRFDVTTGETDCVNCGATIEDLKDESQNRN